MAQPIPRALVEFILLGPEDDRRQLQDSPILGDVWMEYARNPDAALDLLFTPFRDFPASSIAARLSEAIEAVERKKPRGHAIASLQGIAAARLTFDEVVRYVVPLTYWWRDKRIAKSLGEYVASRKALELDAGAVLVAAYNWAHKIRDPKQAGQMRMLPAHKRYIVLAGLILWGGKARSPTKARGNGASIEGLLGAKGERIKTVVNGVADALGELLSFQRLFQSVGDTDEKRTVWTVSLNRRATPALEKSVAAVKGDAARSLFEVSCREIGWAVIDSGIDAVHYALRDREGNPRVKGSFDFTRLRDIVSLDNRFAEFAETRAKELLEDMNLVSPPTPAQARKALKELAEDAAAGRSVDWKLVEQFVAIKPQTAPHINHGTHVAGIIGADRKAVSEEARRQEDPKYKAPAGQALPDEAADGMCPDITLYDFRVLAPTVDETEFNIIGALQFIRYLNEHGSYMTIHGANLSMSIPHSVRNYACGRTPVCVECERLVASGVVVVAAAGNRGYQNFQTQDGYYEGYAAFSVTDPGNADTVITVGSTHRNWPHTYGVSFFSSRGPTGDGRMKPDLVAPGERIHATLPGQAWGDMDGTSMATPHVSGAAAMLMARYPELKGQPRRVKQILCDSATDLGRERTFQGHGMLDVLRAFQSI